MEDTPEKYQKPRKRFHKSDALIYTFTEVETPLLKEGPDQYNTFIRSTRLVYASKDATWQDIASEVLHKMNTIRDDKLPPIQSVEAEEKSLGTDNYSLLTRIEMARDVHDLYLQELAMSTPIELLDAERRCPYSKFVKSCRSHFEEKGFLSPAQREALTYTGTPFRKERYANGSPPAKEDSEDPRYSRTFTEDDIPF